ncbi:MAG TPA: tRNA (adenosine(37)-N6)-threonylcarbamoyltransferase complex transferase subunit TsaD [Candidatus Paceibacterota bacterium]|nr:tRNA (adenosine(37)-N6)-threonylcarbamoyltransferase complex transferase subunit TsaD [Candidatus Paceibacterota bacterium]
MKILAIETSCDETAVAVVEASGGGSFSKGFAGLSTRREAPSSASFKILGNALLSQVEKHAEYGGVFPALAKREHAKNLVPLLEAALEEAELLHESEQELDEALRASLADLLAREGALAENLLEFLKECERPALDAIAVTAGPGLEPALWVGINFAKALAAAWGLPIVAVNHMEGHVLAGLAQKSGETLEIKGVEVPILALLISGGHTELVLMREWLEYELIGQTRDDAVGEAFDKVARMLGLLYPGGPQISKLAEAARNEPDDFIKGLALPRPMLHDATCDFSFAGLKTAVLYLLKKQDGINDEDKKRIALAFEEAVSEVLWAKTARALKETGAKTVVIGGGVSANTHIRRVFKENIAKEFPGVDLRIPSADLTTDNALMIALAGYFRALRSDFADPATLSASGALSLA